MRACRERLASQQERVDRREVFGEEEKGMGEKTVNEKKGFAEEAKE